jgi:hypothetical protein
LGESVELSFGFEFPLLLQTAAANCYLDLLRPLRAQLLLRVPPASIPSLDGELTIFGFEFPSSLQVSSVEFPSPVSSAPD